MTALRVQQGGAGEPLLLLLHGLGATGDVWRALLAELENGWPGRWLIPDLPGHGGSPALPSYSLEALATAVASAVPPADRIVALGHSLGGAVAVALASGRFGVRLAAVCGLGIKVVWTDDELARARTLATRPNPQYPTRAEAAERHLKLAGLTGLVGLAAVADAALVEADGTWSVAFDPRAFAVGAPDMKALLAASRAPVVLAAGERDPMCTAEQLRALVSDPVILPGLGHNAHVEDPAALWPLLRRML